MAERFIRESDVIENIDEWIDSVGYATIGKNLSYYAELKGCIEDAPTIEAILPPFKLGDTVYWLNGMGVIKEYQIKAIQYTFDNERNQWRIDLGEGFMPVYPQKALYLNKEEAEKAAENEKKSFDYFMNDLKESD